MRMLALMESIPGVHGKNKMMKMKEHSQSRGQVKPENQAAKDGERGSPEPQRV
jgi:hypothetical protein